MTTSHPTPAPMRAYRITCAGLDYTALAPSSCQAAMDAQALHGLRTVVVKPLQPAAKGAA